MIVVAGAATSSATRSARCVAKTPLRTSRPTRLAHHRSALAPEVGWRTACRHLLEQASEWMLPHHCVCQKYYSDRPAMSLTGNVVGPVASSLNYLNKTSVPE